MNIRYSLLVVAASCGLFTITHSASGQGTAFTYQGRLNSSGSPANGSYDVQFTLFSASSGGSAVAGPIVKNGIGVTNGLFTTTVDFGGVFPGATNWLELAVRTNGASSFSQVLAPRQPLTPTPYAIYAETANATNLVGKVSSANLSGVALLAGGNAFTGNQSIAGNVGVGTSSPFTQLANSPNNIYGTDGYGLGSQSFGWYGTGFGYTAGFFNPGIGSASEGVVIGIQGTAARVLELIAGANQSVMVVNGNGKVGIGTNNPAALLDVNGSAHFAGTISGDGGGLTNLNVAQLTSTGNNLVLGNLFIGATGNTTTTGYENTSIGFDALPVNTIGYANTASGDKALYSNTTGNQNTADGHLALQENTTGYDNTATGTFALESNTNGWGNTATGVAALIDNTSGINNSATGFLALYFNTTGSNNTAVGASALNHLVTGNNNIALGYQAGYNLSSNESGNIDIGNLGVAGDNNIIRIGTPGTQSNTYIAGVINGDGSGLTNFSARQLTGTGNPGFQNLFVGPSGNANTRGGNNTAIGFAALQNNDYGSDNTAIGNWAMQYNANGNENTGLGTGALYANMYGSQNTAIGYYTLPNISNGSNNIAVGYLAGHNHSYSESDNIDIGSQGEFGENGVIHIGTPGIQTNTYIAGVINGDGAGLTNLNVAQLTMTGNNLGNQNFFVGPAGNSSTSGYNNTALGVHSLVSNTTGTYNTASGAYALLNNTTGSDNTAFGEVAAISSTTGTQNTCVGAAALYSNSTGSDNTAVGYVAVSSCTIGTQNTGVGAGALYSNSTGSDNTALGDDAMNNLTSGSNNIAVGLNAGTSLSSSESGNIDIGNNGAAGDNNIIRIGTPGLQTNTYIAGTTIVTNRANFVSSGSSVDPSIFLRLYNSSSDGGLSSADVAGIGFGQSSTRQAIVGGTFGNDFLDFYTGGVLTKPRMRIDVSGNVGIGTGTNVLSNPLVISNGAYCSVAGVWTSVSDRNVKEDFETIDPQSVLAKIAAMPITQWKYKVEPTGIKHMGPVAQDFHSAFGLGDNEKAIGSVDEGGVALAAIQGLNQKLDAKDAEIAALKRENEAMEQKLDALQKLVQTALKRP